MRSLTVILPFLRWSTAETMYRLPPQDKTCVLGFRLMHARVVVLLCLLMLCLSPAAQAQPAPPIFQEPQVLPLWAGRAPGALGDEESDRPTMTVYMPPNTAGPLTAVIIAPGGSYQRLSMNLEGRAPANYFNALGMAAFVLRYRLGP